MTQFVHLSQNLLHYFLLILLAFCVLVVFTCFPIKTTNPVDHVVSCLNLTQGFTCYRLLPESYTFVFYITMFIYIYFTTKNKEWHEKLSVNDVKVLPKNNLNSQIFEYLYLKWHQCQCYHSLQVHNRKRQLKQWREPSIRTYTQTLMPSGTLWGSVFSPKNILTPCLRTFSC